jgi:hypothetical protein
MILTTLIFGGIMIPVTVILWYVIAASAEAKRRRKCRQRGFLTSKPLRR